jgi:hypothetical protein
MNKLGYMPLGEASALTGVSTSLLSKWCQQRLIRWAIKEKGAWLVPHSELVKVPDPSRDDVLNGLVYASQLGFNIPITLFMRGVVLTGWLTTAREHLEQCRDDMYAAMDELSASQDDLKAADLKRHVDDLLKGPADIDTPYEELFDIQTDPDYYDFCYIKEVNTYAKGRRLPEVRGIIRVRLASIDAYSYGFTKLSVKKDFDGNAGEQPLPSNDNKEASV